MKNGPFYLGVGFLLTHELDAVSNSEWLVLPLVSWLAPEVAKLTFILAHIPIFAVLVALISSSKVTVRNKTKFGVSVFLVVHGLLHAVFIGHANYEFSSWLSNLLIFGGAFFGGAHLFLNRSKATT